MSLKIIKIFFLFLLISCDFSPWVHREIIEAQDLIRVQDYKTAILRYEKILKGNLSKDIKLKIYFQIGEICSIHLGDYEKSVLYFSKILKLTEDPAWLIQTEEKLAEINFSFLKNYSSAFDHYKILTKFRPKLSNYDFFELRLAQSLLNLNRHREANTIFKNISQNIEHSYRIRSLYFLGLLEFQKKNWKNAINYWKQYIKVEKRKDNIVQAKFLMANAYETNEDLKNAYDLYYSLLGEYPNTTVVKNRLQSIYERRIARKR